MTDPKKPTKRDKAAERVRREAAKAEQQRKRAQARARAVAEQEAARARANKRASAQLDRQLRSFISDVFPHVYVSRAHVSADKGDLRVFLRGVFPRRKDTLYIQNLIAERFNGPVTMEVEVLNDAADDAALTLRRLRDEALALDVESAAEAALHRARQANVDYLRVSAKPLNAEAVVWETDPTIAPAARKSADRAQTRVTVDGAQVTLTVHVMPSRQIAHSVLRPAAPDEPKKSATLGVVSATTSSDGVTTIYELSDGHFVNVERQRTRRAWRWETDQSWETLTSLLLGALRNDGRLRAIGPFKDTDLTGTAARRWLLDQRDLPAESLIRVDTMDEVVAVEHVDGRTLFAVVFPSDDFERLRVYTEATISSPARQATTIAVARRSGQQPVPS